MERKTKSVSTEKTTKEKTNKKDSIKEGWASFGMTMTHKL